MSQAELAYLFDLSAKISGALLGIALLLLIYRVIAGNNNQGRPPARPLPRYPRRPPPADTPPDQMLTAYQLETTENRLVAHQLMDEILREQQANQPSDKDPSA